MNEPISVFVEQTATVTVESLQQGPPGPQGSSAAEELVQYTAGGSISAYQPVFQSGSMSVMPATGENATHAGRIVGLSTNAASAGGTVYCKRSGSITNPAWALTSGARYYIGAGGELTTDAANMAYSQKLGVAESATSLFLQIEPPIII